MAVIDLRDDPARTAQLFAALGSGVGSIVKAFESDEETFINATKALFAERPDLLARAQREHEASGVEGPGPAELLGISPEVAEQISNLFPPSAEEIEDRLRREMGAVDVGVEAEVAGAGRDIEVAETEGALARARREVGVPGATAEAEAELALLEGETARKRREAGIPDLQVLSEVSELQLGRELNEREMEKLGELQKLYETLPPDEARRLSISEVAPAYLSDIQHRERLSLQEALARFRVGTQQGKSQFELAADALDVKRKFLDEFERIEEDLQEGDFEAGEAEAIIRRYNDLANDWAFFFPDSPVTIIDPLEALFGKDIKDVSRFRTLMPDDLRATIAAARILQGEATPEQLMEELENSVPDPATREKILNATMQRVEGMQTQAQKGMMERFLEWATAPRPGLEAGKSPNIGPPSLRIPSGQR